jgi:hypothetical protein
MLESSWNVMAHGDAREGKWRENWRMEWVAKTLHTTSELGVSSIITVYMHTSAASSRLNWRPCPFKWTRPFRRKTKSGFCACAITFQKQSNNYITSLNTDCLKFSRKLPLNILDCSNYSHCDMYQFCFFKTWQFIPYIGVFTLRPLSKMKVSWAVIA